MKSAKTRGRVRERNRTGDEGHFPAACRRVEEILRESFCYRGWGFPLSGIFQEQATCVYWSANGWKENSFRGRG